MRRLVLFAMALFIGMLAVSPAATKTYTGESEPCHGGTIYENAVERGINI
ncbi:MAG: hypothetical protein SVJ22_05650 [Halobacteriota archaeon]|nr:hypothetical protein [Halobacteriota archaeon]